MARVTPEKIEGQIVYEGNELALSKSLIQIDGVVMVPLKQLADSMRLKMFF
ncbi:MAG: hypothetical protein KKA19_07680 [Candidatus Margulisbacteria bacterium]|nr:hypothetical protein [Candidatus Margulisiibacteriota bacterium]